MIIRVCVGSACHIKGSYAVIEEIKSFIKVNALEEVIELKSSFCLGHCSEGVAVAVDGGRILSVTPETVESMMRGLMEEVVA